MNITRGFKLVVAAVLAATSTPIMATAADGTAQQTTELPQVCLYYEDNFKGQEVCTHKTIMPLLGPFNDKFASFKMKNGAKLILCTEQIFNKACKVFDDDVARIEDAFYKNTRSLQVFITRPTNDFACLFTQPDYAGRRICHPHGDNINLAGNWLDNVSSLLLFGKAELEICTELNLTGTCGTIASSGKSLPENFDNAVKSFKVTRVE